MDLDRVSCRELLDGIIQDIYAGTLQLDDLAEGSADAELRKHLHGVVAHFSSVITDIRSAIQGLSVGQPVGGTPIENLVALVQEVCGRDGLTVSYSVSGAPYPLPDQVAHGLVQITHEALSNVVKRALTTTAHVCLSYAVERVTLVVSDDARGFDPQSLWTTDHRSLRNLYRRTEELGGAINILSGPRMGTTITVAVPFPFRRNLAAPGYQ